MPLQETAIPLLTSVLSNKAAKAFTSDFITTTIQWIRPWFLKDDPSAAASLDQAAQPEATAALVEAKLPQLLENEQFKQELAAWFAKSQQSQYRRENIAENIEVDVKTDIHIGNKTAESSDAAKERNVAKDSTFKSSDGGFHLGDG